MRVFAIVAAVLSFPVAMASTANVAAKTKKTPPPVQRSAAGTVIQPTRTIIHNPDGTTTIIVTPRRSYLDPGTEVSVGDGSYRDYMLPPGGDPGRPDWFYGPAATGAGGYPLARPFFIPGYNPDTPF
jgi:hypothetical protein